MGRYDNLGLYDNGKVFGIHMYIYYYEGEHINVVYEKKYDELMSDEQKKEAYLFYTELKNKNTELNKNQPPELEEYSMNNNNEIHFLYYTECRFDGKYILRWHPMSLELFLEKFSV